MLHLMKHRARFNGTLFVIIFYWFLSAIKIRHFFIQGRFWAEEGKYFYHDIRHLPSLDGILYLFNGHLELATNLCVYVSTLVSPIYAPAITSHLSLLIQIIPMALLAHYREDFGIGTLGLVVLVTIVLGLPQSAEVWANSINLHFHLTVLVMLIAALSRKTPSEQFILIALVSFAGLSGIPPNFMLPILWCKAAMTKDREHLAYASALSITSVIQICLVTINFSEIGHRPFELVVPEIFLAIIAQQGISPIFGTVAAGYIIPLMNYALSGTWQLYFSVFFLGLPVMYIYLGAFRSRKLSMKILGASSLLVVTACILTGLDETIVLVSVASGGRYFFASNFIFFLTAILVFKSRRNIVLGLLLACAFLVSLSGGFQLNISGANWWEALKKAQQNRSDQVPIWPNSWYMANPMHEN